MPRKRHSVTRKCGLAADMPTRRARLTGTWLPPQGGRGRPREYVSDNARILSARLEEVEGRLGNLVAVERPVWSPEALRLLRGQFYAMANLLNAAEVEGGRKARPAPGRKLGHGNRGNRGGNRGGNRDDDGGCSCR